MCQERDGLLSVVAHTFIPSTLEAEAGGSLSLRPAWSTERVPEQLELQRETLSGKANKRKEGRRQERREGGRKKEERQEEEKGWRCSSVAEHFPSVCESPGRKVARKELRFGGCLRNTEVPVSRLYV